MTLSTGTLGIMRVLSIYIGSGRNSTITCTIHLTCNKSQLESAGDLVTGVPLKSPAEETGPYKGHMATLIAGYTIFHEPPSKGSK